MAKQIKITWTKSCIGCPEKQKKIVKSLGFTKLQQTLIKADNPAIRGQISKIQHLLLVEEID